MRSLVGADEGGEEMLKNMRFWLDHGVDGFRIDAFDFLFEDDEFRNETRNLNDDFPRLNIYLDENISLLARLLEHDRAC